MAEERNLQARRLIASQLVDLDAEADRQERRRRSLATQATRNREALTQLDAERAGLRQALEALGGEPPAEVEE